METRTSRKRRGRTEDEAIGVEAAARQLERVEQPPRIPERIVAKASQKRGGVCKQVFLVKYFVEDEPEYKEAGELEGYEALIATFLAERRRESSSSSRRNNQRRALLPYSPAAASTVSAVSSSEPVSTPQHRLQQAAEHQREAVASDGQSLVWKAMQITRTCGCKEPCAPGVKHVQCVALQEYPAETPEGPCSEPLFVHQGNTSNPWSHLRRHHRSVFALLKAAGEERSRANAPAQSGGLQGLFNKATQEKLDTTIAMWVCESNRPIAIVTDPLLRLAFDIATGSQLRLPQKEKVLGEIVMLEARSWQAICDLVESLAVDGIDISIACDIWSQDGAALLGLVGYAIVFRHGHFHLVEFVLAAAAFSEVCYWVGGSVGGSVGG
eukprot:GHVU01129251.1.p1 GENE.GHVU01129251.1~~GHVU01129251.1.p1  ORF type:complete len:382 (-),score=34.79 GHVU01129251.1:2306-3451(-)